MDKKVDKKKAVENGGRVTVLAGKKRVEEMLVFLAYRKLKKNLESSPLRMTAKKDEKE